MRFLSETWFTPLILASKMEFYSDSLLSLSLPLSQNTWKYGPG